MTQTPAEQFRQALLKSEPQVVMTLEGLSYMSLVWEQNGHRQSKVMPAGNYMLICANLSPGSGVKKYDFKLRQAMAQAIENCAIKEFKPPTRSATGISNPRLFKKVLRQLRSYGLIELVVQGTPTQWAVGKEVVLKWWADVKSGKIHPEDWK